MSKVEEPKGSESLQKSETVRVEVHPFEDENLSRMKHRQQGDWPQS